MTKPIPELGHHLRPSIAKTWNLGDAGTITLNDGKATVNTSYRGAITKDDLNQIIETLMFVQQEME